MFSNFALKVIAVLLAVFFLAVAVAPCMADSTITDKADCEGNLLGSWSDLGSDGLGECHH
jgi:hypothetical protein